MPRGRRRSTLGGLESQLQAIDAQRRKIVEQIRLALTRLTAGNYAPPEVGAARLGPGRPKGSGQKRGRRKMSAAARKRISEAHKARWAKQKAAK